MDAGAGAVAAATTVGLAGRGAGLFARDGAGRERGASAATAPGVWAGGVPVGAAVVAAPVFGAAAGEVAVVAVGRVGVLAAGVDSVAIAGFGAVAGFGAATLEAAGRAGGSISRLTLGAGAAAGGTSGER